MVGRVTTIEDGTPFVTLGIDREVFAVPVAAVLEILDMQSVSRIPDAPPYLVGLIAVRGRGVPVIDLRIRLGLPAAPVTGHTRILVLDMPFTDRHLTLGLVVDRVFEVTPLDNNSIEPPPDIGIRWRSDYIDGVGRRGEHFVIVLNLSQLFSTDDVPLVGGGGIGAVLASANSAVAALPWSGAVATQ